MLSHLINLKKKFTPSQSTSLNKEAGETARVLIIGDTLVDDYLTSICMSTTNITLNHIKANEKPDILLKKKVYHLIFIGLENNAEETLQLIRERESFSQRTPVITIEPPKGRKQLILSLSKGFDDYLVKPVKKADVEVILARWLEDFSFKADKENTTAHKDLTEEDEKTTLSGNIKKTVDIEASLRYSHQNNELARDLLLLLIKSIKSEKNKAINFYRNNEWEALGDLAHKLNGGSCYCGVPDLQEKTKALEHAVNTKNYSEIESVFPQLIRAMDELTQWNETYDLDVIFHLE